jgi:hypothetical protein
MICEYPPILGDLLMLWILKACGLRELSIDTLLGWSQSGPQFWPILLTFAASSGSIMELSENEGKLPTSNGPSVCSQLGGRLWAVGRKLSPLEASSHPISGVGSGQGTDVQLSLQ